MKALVLIGLLIAAPVSAQPSLLADLQAERARFGTPMSKAEVGELLNAVAARNPGWVLLSKPSGNNCPAAGTLVSCDYLVWSTTGAGFDVFIDSEGIAKPTWNPGDSFGPDRYVQPVRPSTPHPAPSTSIPPVPFYDLSGFVDDVRASLGRLERNVDGIAETQSSLMDALETLKRKPPEIIIQPPAPPPAPPVVKADDGGSGWPMLFVKYVLPAFLSALTTWQVTTSR